MGDVMHSVVLLVEDDPAVQAALVQALGGKGYRVRPVRSAAAALREAASTTQLDMIILDLGLPDLDGAAAMRMIRAVSNVPIIVATGTGGAAEWQRLSQLGASAFLVKPFDAGQLITLARGLLGATGRLRRTL